MSKDKAMKEVEHRKKLLATQPAKTIISWLMERCSHAEAMERINDLADAAEELEQQAILSERARIEDILKKLLDRERRYLAEVRERKDDDEIKDGLATTQTLEEVIKIINQKQG